MKKKKTPPGPPRKPLEPVVPRYGYGQPPRPKKVKKPATVMMPLRARHSITSATGESYVLGPGLTSVPSHLVEHLQHAEERAVEHDEKFYSNQQPSVLVLPATGTQRYRGVKLASTQFAKVLSQGIDLGFAV